MSTKKPLVTVRDGVVTIVPDPDDMSEQIKGAAQRLKSDQKLTDGQRDALLVAIAQHLGIV